MTEACNPLNLVPETMLAPPFATLPDGISMTFDGIVDPPEQRLTLMYHVRGPEAFGFVERSRDGSICGLRAQAGASGFVLADTGADRHGSVLRTDSDSRVVIVGSRQGTL